MSDEEPKGWFLPESRRAYLHETHSRIAPELWRVCLGAHLLHIPNESIEARRQGTFGLPLE